MTRQGGFNSRSLSLWLPLGIFLLLALGPFYWMLITSLKPNAELYNTRIMPLVVHHPTLKHYTDLLTETSFLTWTYNTTVVAVLSTAILLVLGIMLAYPLARMRFAGAGLIAATVAAAYLVPQPFLFIPLADIINNLGLSDTLTSVVLTYPTMLIPFCAWLLMGYFKTVPGSWKKPHVSTGRLVGRPWCAWFCRCACPALSRQGSSPSRSRKTNSCTP
jgi:multiple sugar transport system permease protein